MQEVSTCVCALLDNNTGCLFYSVSLSKELRLGMSTQLTACSAVDGVSQQCSVFSRPCGGVLMPPRSAQCLVDFNQALLTFEGLDSFVSVNLKISLTLNTLSR